MRRFTVATPDGLRLAAYAWPGPVGAPALLWGHANGFAALAYRPLLERLAATAHVFAWDARGHGKSETPHPADARTLHLDRFAQDLGAVAADVRAQAGRAPLHFAGHSFSGVAALRLGAVFGEAPWAGMALFEPPLTPTPDEPGYAEATRASEVLTAAALRRRPRWPSPAVFAQSLAGRPAFARFRPDMLAAHAAASLHETPDGDYGLRCAPATEAAIYRAVLNPTTYRALPFFPLPVRLVASARDSGEWLPRAQRLAGRRLPHASVVTVPDSTHLLPFEQPEMCANIIVDMWMKL